MKGTGSVGSVRNMAGSALESGKLCVEEFLVFILGVPRGRNLREIEHAKYYFD